MSYGINLKCLRGSPENLKYLKYVGYKLQKPIAL